METIYSIALLFTAGALIGLVPVLNWERTEKLAPLIPIIGVVSGLLIIAGVVAGMYVGFAVLKR